MFKNLLKVLRGTAILGLVLVLAAGPFLSAVHAQEPATIVDLTLYDGMGRSTQMVGSSAQQYTGEGSWNSNHATVEWYISPEAYGVGPKTIGDIESVEYYSYNTPVTGGAPAGVDFGLYIYTKGTAHGWYGERLTAEPLYTPGNVDPDNTWNLFTTDTLTWYARDHSVPMGWATAPTLAQMQEDDFRWSDYWTGADTTVVDYSAMEIGSFKFGTGSAWSANFDGYLDAIQINFTDGDQITLDLENQPDTLYVDDSWITVPPMVQGTDPDGDGPATAFGSDAFTSIQPAINAAVPGATISIFPGSYPTGISITSVNPDTGGAGGNSFILFANKPSITLQGVDEDANPITDVDDVAANITATAKAPTFGASALFIQADDVTVTGLEITPFEPNKTVEVWGDNFTMRHSQVHSGLNGATIYFNDTKVSAYTVDQNFLEGGIAIASGAGTTGPVENRQITGNTIDSTIYGIGFRGENIANVAWYAKPVGGAVITGNTFRNDPYGHVYADGVYAEDELDWDEILASNTFDKTVVMTNSEGELANNTWVYSYSRPNLRRIASRIQPELGRAADGDTLTVSAGLFPEDLTFSASVENVSLVGAGADETIIEAPDNTPGFCVTLAGPVSLIQGVTIRNNGTPDSAGIVWGYQGSGSQLLESKVEGFLTGIYLSSGVENAVIENNEITGNANGLLFEGALTTTVIRYNDITGNTQSDSYWTGKENASIRVLDTFTGVNNVIRFNALTGSERAVDNNSEEEIAAERNWWGSKFGPAEGDLELGGVDGDPWLCSDTDTEADLIGFQPAITDTCTAGAGTRLVFATQPDDTMMTKTFAASPALRVEDADGNLVVTFNDDVTLTLNKNSQNVTLRGTNTVAAVDGVATFPGLSVSRWGYNFTFTASAEGLASATSDMFEILGLKMFLPMLFNP